MVSKIEVDTVVNQSGDQDSGLDLSTNDAVKIKIANSVKAEVDSSGHVKLDTVKGYTSAASVNVVGEGGSTTTNLQQGLAKHWVQMNGTGTVAVHDSFNNASLTDNGTGFYNFNLTNSMSNDDYACSEASNRVDVSGNGVMLHTAIGGTGTGLYNVYNVNNSGATVDVTQIFGLAFGDLA